MKRKILAFGLTGLLMATGLVAMESPVTLAEIAKGLNASLVVRDNEIFKSAVKAIKQEELVGKLFAKIEAMSQLLPALNSLRTHLDESKKAAEELMIMQRCARAPRMNREFNDADKATYLKSICKGDAEICKPKIADLEDAAIKLGCRGKGDRQAFFKKAMGDLKIMLRPVTQDIFVGHGGKQGILFSVLDIAEQGGVKAQLEAVVNVMKQIDSVLNTLENLG